MCEMLSDAGFFSGLWDGLIAIFSLIADIFWNVEVYNHCQYSWWYDLGFYLGIMALSALIGHETLPVGLVVLVVLFVIWVLTLMFKATIYVAPFAAVLVLLLVIASQLGLLGDKGIRRR